MATSKAYTVSTETANGIVDIPALIEEIQSDPAIPIALASCPLEGDTVTPTFQADIDAYISALDTRVGAHTGVPIEPDARLVHIDVETPAGIPKVAVVKPDGEGFKSLVSHEWTKKETWYSTSNQVTGETLGGSGTGPYTSANGYWIDCINGHLTDQDILAATYGAKIYDNGSEVTSGFTIDHVNGTVSFSTAPTGPVTADYSYAVDSTWIVKPDAGKVIKIEHAEVDFTVDADVHKTHFEIWGYNPADLPNKMMYDRRTYNNIKDVIKIANQVDVVDAIGGLTNKVVRMVFDYAELIELKDSQGLEMRIYIADHQPLNGEFSSTTIYTTIEDE